MNSNNHLDKKYNSFWFADKTFPLIVALISAGVFAGTGLFITHGVGLINDIGVGALLVDGISTGSYAGAAAFGVSFLFARVLEGGLVGVLDIGGSINTGVGVGIPAIFLAAGITAPLENFFLSLVVGASLGVIIGIIIISVKKTTVGRVQNSDMGVSIFMGAGNAVGKWLGPLIMLTACGASIPVGIGSILGGAIFHKIGKPVAGGAIIGAMLLGMFFPIPPTE